MKKIGKLLLTAVSLLLAIVKWLFLVVLLLVVLIISSIAYFTATETGYRQLPRVISAVSPYQITYESLNGHFWSRQQWQGLTVSGPGIDLQAKKLVLDNTSGLSPLRIAFAEVGLSDAEIQLESSSNTDDSSSGIPNQLPQIELPFIVTLQNVLLERVRVVQDDVELIDIERAALDADYRNGQLDTQLDFNSNLLDSKLNAQITTLDDYPLSIDGDLTLHQEPQAQHLTLKGQGSVLSPSLKIDTSGMATLRATLQGNIDLKEKHLDTTLDWQELAYEDIVQSSGGKLHVSGAFDRINVELDTQLSGADIPPLNIVGSADVSAEQAENIHLLVDALKGQIAFDGAVTFAPHLRWQGKLRADDIDGRAYSEDLDITLNADIETAGELSATQQQASLRINTLDGHWQDKALRGSGALLYNDGRVNADAFYVSIAGNELTADGVLGTSDSALNLNLSADHLHALLPALSGSVSGTALLSGNMTDPQIDTDIHWQNLAYRDNGETVFASEKGKLQAQGSLQGLDVQTDLTAKGRDFPESRLDGSAHVTQERISDIDLTLYSGDGRADVRGEATLKPYIGWTLDVQTKQLDPGRFVEGYSGSVNADLTTTGSIDENGKINAEAEIKSMDGTLNGEPLKGKGKITFDDGALAMRDVSLGLGDNRIDVAGGYQGDKLDLQFDIDGRNLSTLYKPLGGTLSAKGTIVGTLTTPDIDLTASAKGIRYEDYQIASADIRIDSGLHDGGNFNNDIQLTGVDLAGQRWQALKLKSDGSFGAHQLALNTTGGDINLNLAARGGLQSLDSWSGKLEQLALTGQGLNWKLQQPSDLALSPQDVQVNNFCLGDGISALCVDVQHQQDTKIAYRIEQLSPKSFATFIPDIVHTGITANGKGDIYIAENGEMKGMANIALRPGRLVIAPKDSPPITLNLTEGRINAAFQGQQANIQSDIAFAKAGEIHLRSKINNFSSPSLDGELAVDIPNIGEFRYLVPMVSDLKGKVSGKLRVSGAASNPTVGGQIILDGGAVVIPQYATELQDIRLQLAAAQTGQIDINGRIGTPKGALDINGALGLSPLRLNLNLGGKNMLIANAESMRVIVSPTFAVTIDPDKGINVDGKVIIPEARVSIPDTSGGVSVSKDVVIVGKDNKTTQQKIKQAKTPFNAKIGVELGDKVYFDSSTIDIRLIGGITVFLRPNRPITAEGRISVASGIYELYGQELDIRQGRATFSGNNIANPLVDVLALREIDDVKVGAKITGTVEQLHLTLTSTPTMPDSAILSYLLFGRAPDAGTDMDGLLQTAGNFALGGVLPNNLSQKTGLDVLDIGISGLKAGKYLGDDLYVGMQSNFFNAMTEFIARYQFSKRLKAEATASNKDKAVDFIYQFESN